MLSNFLFYFVFVYFITQTQAIQCHQCGGQERMSKMTKKIYTELNIMPDQYFGNCKATSGNDVCSNGTFCIKRAKIHKIGFNSFNYKVTSYTKGCATVREDNGQTPSNGCFDLNQDTTKIGYTTKRVDCYCDKDFCNSVSTFGSAIFLIGLWTAFFVL
uniref:Protein sleepless n=1 Tax=Caenorhabditis tropicalis TaxID=1561998 RepID=A0A1I7TQS8_9PELO